MIIHDGGTPLPDSKPFIGGPREYQSFHRNGGGRGKGPWPQFLTPAGVAVTALGMSVDFLMSGEYYGFRGDAYIWNPLQLPRSS